MCIKKLPLMLRNNNKNLVPYRTEKFGSDRIRITNTAKQTESILEFFYLNNFLLPIGEIFSGNIMLVDEQVGTMLHYCLQHKRRLLV
jgi:hypothetical protein